MQLPLAGPCVGAKVRPFGETGNRISTRLRSTIEPSSASAPVLVVQRRAWPEGSARLWDAVNGW
eukprot:358495-Chlamydomonas_euryale.AAC.3